MRGGDREGFLTRSEPGEALPIAHGRREIGAPELFELRFMLKKIDVRRRPRHVHEDHPFGLRRVMRQTDQTPTGNRLGSGRVAPQERGQRHDTNPPRTALQESPAEHLFVERVEGIHGLYSRVKVSSRLRRSAQVCA